MDGTAPPDDGSLKGRHEEDLPQQDSEDSMAIESVSTKEEWRGIARLVQAETDPEKLMELAQQLISEFDKDQSPASPIAGAPTKSNGRGTSKAKDEDGLMHGEQHGTTRPTQ